MIMERLRPDADLIKRLRSELAANASTAERDAYDNLARLGYDAVRQYPIWTGRKLYFADLYIPSLKTVVEIDGGYHATRRQKRLDRNRSSGLWRLGFHVVRLSNHDARNMGKVSAKIISVLKAK